MGKVDVYDKIMIENQKNLKIKEILHKCPSSRWFTNGIHRLLSRADPEGALTFLGYSM